MHANKNDCSVILSLLSSIFRCKIHTSTSTISLSQFFSIESTLYFFSACSQPGAVNIQALHTVVERPNADVASLVQCDCHCPHAHDCCWLFVTRLLPCAASQQLWVWLTLEIILSQYEVLLSIYMWTW